MTNEVETVRIEEDVLNFADSIIDAFCLDDVLAQADGFLAAGQEREYSEYVRRVLREGARQLAAGAWDERDDEI
jgi:hypothetical protein